MKHLVFFLSIVCTIAQAIQIRDDQDTIESFPMEFIEQSDYFNGMMENPSYKQPFLLPSGISNYRFKEFFEQSKSKFEDIPLEKLTDYFVVANALIFNNIQNQLLKQIYDQLKQLPSTMSSVQAKKLAVKKALRNIFHLPYDNFDLALRKIIFAEEYNLNERMLHTISEKYPELVKYSILSSLFIPETLEFKNIIITQDNQNKIIYVLPDGTFRITNSDLLKLLIPQHFDISSVYLSAYSPLADSALLNKDKILILHNHGPRTTRIILPLPKESNDPWFHVAFSPMDSKMTAVQNGNVFLIDYGKEKITKLNLPDQVLSSLLLSDDVILYRTVERKTYLFDLAQNTKKIIDSEIAYYTLAEEDQNSFNIYGLKKTSTGVELKKEIISI